jgi:hypothetical protein
MTKVIISKFLLEYRQAMASAVEKVRRQNNIVGLEPCRFAVPFQPQKDVISSSFRPCSTGPLQPPRIEALHLDIGVRDGYIEGLIQVWTSADFGTWNLYLIITDGQGDLVESGFAIRSDYSMNLWLYMFEADSDACRSFTVQAVAMDYLGGTGMRSETTTI